MPPSPDPSGPHDPASQTPADEPPPSYEAARDELAEVVATLETGGLTLEESLRLWERGEALAAHCQSWLDAAKVRLDAAAEPGDSADRA